MVFAIATFSLAAALIVLLPGPDTLVVIRSIVRGGRPAGVATATGNLVGLAVWVAAASLGLAALLRASHAGYEILRIAGAVYLVWLGVQSIRNRAVPRAAAGPAEPRRRRNLVGTGFRAGVITNLLNPKVGVFFVTFLPGFVPHGDSVGLTSFLFGAIFILETAGYWVVLLSLATKVTAWMAQARTKRRLDTATGAILIGFGLRLAVES
ncbi:MAG: LysE family translocator [Actinomycetota bacterium]|nr:LysE family translocator [Actinomycetota bacterium]